MRINLEKHEECRSSVILEIKFNYEIFILNVLLTFNYFYKKNTLKYLFFYLK